VGIRSRTPPTVADADDVDAAEAVALRILGGASQSAAALQQRLVRRGYSARAAAEAVDRCRVLGYVDDGALAESVAGRHRRAGHGRMRILADLRQRGISEQALSDTVVELEIDEEAAARAAADVLLDRAERRDSLDERALRRVAAALQRRGFSGGVVRRAIRARVEASAEESRRSGSDS